MSIQSCSEPPDFSRHSDDSLQEMLYHATLSKTERARLHAEVEHRAKTRRQNRTCAHPAGCELLAEAGDIYCSGCASDPMLRDSS